MTKPVHAYYPGSFNPVTPGHLAVAASASVLFERVTFLVAVNPAKNYGVSAEQRATWIRRSVAGIDNIDVEILPQGETVVGHLVKDRNNVIIKGLRGVADVESEFEQQVYNEMLNGNGVPLRFMYMFIPPMKYISSTGLRDTAKLVDYNKFFSMFSIGTALIDRLALPDTLLSYNTLLKEIYKTYHG